MIKIAHRGNMHGPSKDENNPYYIQKALDAGFDVEIDLWLVGKELYAGHDCPQYLIDKKWLKNNEEYMWCHAKNFETLDYLNSNGYNCFFNDKDECVLTSKKFIWRYPFIYSSLTMCGVCSDYVGAM